MKLGVIILANIKHYPNYLSFFPENLDYISVKIVYYLRGLSLYKSQWIILLELISIHQHAMNGIILLFSISIIIPLNHDLTTRIDIFKLIISETLGTNTNFLPYIYLSIYTIPFI